MGYNRYKVTYECDCGIDYGSCGRQNAWLLAYHRGSDTAQLYHRHHTTNPTHLHEGKLELVDTFTDNKLAALSKLLDRENSEPWSDEDYADAAH